MVRWLMFIVCLGLFVSRSLAEELTPLMQAHAHNDYHHKRPLLEALDHGFCSVEVDIFLVGGSLLVGHDRGELKPGKTLQSLYLDPLRERVRKNGGRVYSGGPSFTLLIDIKSNSIESYRALSVLLAKYADLLSGLSEGEWTDRAVTAIISGNRAKDLIAADMSRCAGIDGRIADLGSSSKSHLIPLISDRWGSHFKWKGVGDFSEPERSKLRGIVSKAHGEGRRVRFWATPDRISVWRELRQAGVDLINTDDLAGLRDFLKP